MKQQSQTVGQTVTRTSSPSRVPQGPPRRHLAVPGGRSRGAGHRPQAALPSVAGKRLGGCFAQAPGRSAQALSTVSRARPEGAALAGQAGPGLSQGACVAGLLASTQLGALRPEFSAPAPGPCGPRGLSTFLTGMPHKATGPHRSGGAIAACVRRACVRSSSMGSTCVACALLWGTVRPACSHTGANLLRPRCSLRGGPTTALSRGRAGRGARGTLEVRWLPAEDPGSPWPVFAHRTM